jgi:hypothetical protein
MPAFSLWAISGETRRIVPNSLLEDVIYRERDFVLIDESHNFRYPDTQRYKAIQAFLATGIKMLLSHCHSEEQDRLGCLLPAKTFSPG